MSEEVGSISSHDRSSLLGKFGICTAIFLLVSLFGLLVYRTFWLTSVDNYELAYIFDLRTGRITRTHRTGYIRSAPIVTAVHTVDLRPMQVCINANSRVLNCKLVQFNPAGLETFLEWHGRSNYDSDTLNPILMSYAYDGSGRTYPFLTVLRELRSAEAVVGVDAGVR